MLVYGEYCHVFCFFVLTRRPVLSFHVVFLFHVFNCLLHELLCVCLHYFCVFFLFLFFLSVKDFFLPLCLSFWLGINQNNIKVPLQTNNLFFA